MKTTITNDTKFDFEAWYNKKYDIPLEDFYILPYEFQLGVFTRFSRVDHRVTFTTNADNLSVYCEMYGDYTVFRTSEPEKAINQFNEYYNGQFED